MTDRLKRFAGISALLFAVVLPVSAVAVIATGSVASAQAACDPATEECAHEVVSTGAEFLKTEMVATAVAVLPFAAAIIAIFLGWRLARKFIRAG